MQPAEATLVNALRGNDQAVLSLVATLEGIIVGHIMFSTMHIDDGAQSWPAVGLAPVNVVETLQKRGIGKALIRTGIDMCRDKGHRRMFVLGHDEYYPKFGFKPCQATYGLGNALDAPDPFFMALEMAEGAFDGVTGTAHYAPEFDDLE